MPESNPSLVLRQFADVLRVNDQGIKALLYEVVNDDLSGALCGAPPGIIDKFCRCMSSRAAMMILENTRTDHISALSPEAVERLRRNIVESLRRLVSEGKAVVDNPDGSIEPDVSPSLALFNKALGWDRKMLRAQAGHLFKGVFLWSTALYGFPKPEILAFLSKFPWLVRRRIKAVMKLNGAPPAPDEIQFARMELGWGMLLGPSCTDSRWPRQ